MHRKFIGNCVYCEELADTIDHIPAKSRRWELVGKYKFHEVPACWDCNIALSNREYHTLHDRRKYLLTKFKRDLRKLVHVKKWTKKEIQELGEGLAARVTADQIQYDFLSGRLVNLEKKIGEYKSPLELYIESKDIRKLDKDTLTIEEILALTEGLE